MYDTLVITGTGGAGKTTVARMLSERRRRFEVVQAVTTRQRREDDIDGQYEYVEMQEFGRLRGGGELLIEARYREQSYGVRRSAAESVRGGGGIPVLVITPEAARRAVSDDPFQDADWRPLVVFIDAKDGVLDRRIEARGVDARSEHDQREADRVFGRYATYTVRAGSPEEVADLIAGLWTTRDRSGVLPGPLIARLLACGTLLENAEPSKVEGASYDLRLGDEYFYGGQIHRLSDEEPILTLEPYDYAIVTSHEVADLPREVSGRFDLTVGLFCQGVILSNGPQVDPGFRGPLFCLLFNTSSSPILLKRRQHYATIEFHKVLWATAGYTGHYQAKTLIDYLPTNAARGAINELKRELEEVRKESKGLQGTTWAILSLVLAMIAVFVSFR